MIKVNICNVEKGDLIYKNLNIVGRAVYCLFCDAGTVSCDDIICGSVELCKNCIFKDNNVFTFKDLKADENIIIEEE